MSRHHPILALTLLPLAVTASAQVRIIGSVPISEAATTGVLSVSGSKNLIGGSSVIAALDRPAHITLFRGGEILVCQSSVAHLTGGEHSIQFVNNVHPLLISLDRGALELHMPITREDALITPDFRVISVEMRDRPAQLNLSMRVTPNGDTCVENSGKHAPTLALTDAFGETTYLLKPRQHVLFEHGSLKEVVDTETSSCGCPNPISMSLADAAIRGRSGKKDKKPTEGYPFPTAVSQGLSPSMPLPAEKSHDTHVQVSGTLAYDPAAQPADTATTPPSAAPPSPPPVSDAPTPVVTVSPPPPLTPQPESKKSPLRSVGHFFKKIFVR